MVEEEDKIGWAIRARSGTKQADELDKSSFGQRQEAKSNEKSIVGHDSMVCTYLTLPPGKLKCDDRDA